MKLRTRFSLPLVIASIVASWPLGASANRPNTRPHHRVPANFRKFVAARTVTLALPSYGGTSNNSTTFSLGATFSFGASETTAIAASNNLVKTGAGTAIFGGTLSLNGGNSYTGATTVNAGSSLTLGTGMLATNTGITSGSTGIANLATSGAGSTLLGGTLIVNGSNLITGNTAVNSGSLTIATGVVSASQQLINSLYSASLIFPTVLTLSSTNAGTVSLSNPVLPDTVTLSLHTGLTLVLDFTGSDAINQLQIDGVAQAAGVWGSLASDAPNKTALITGSGTLTVATTTLISTPSTTADAGGGATEFATATAASASEIQADPATATAAAPEAAPVPEPSSALLLLAGAGILARRRHRG